MLSLTNIALRRGQTVLFEQLSLQVHSGQRLGVIGANGCGKSSLFAMLMGQLEPDAGEFSMNSDDVIAHVAQESPDGSASAIDHVIDGDAELRDVEAAIAAHDNGDTQNNVHVLYERMEAIDGYAAESRAARLLHGLGFSDDDYRKSVSDFSGGWRMRLNLARALMCRSDLLLLDEPTNHLDLPAILWLERWLTSYPGILLIISHDRDFLDAVCTRVAHIENKAVQLYSGNYSSFEAQRAEQLAQQQSMFKRQQREIRHIQGYVDRFRYKASKARQAQSRLKMLQRMERIASAHVDSPFRFHFAEPDKQPQHLLGLNDARLGYGESTVLENVTLNLTAGDRIGLLGVNGAGKSTLVKALSTGDTLLDGERVVSKDTRIGYFAQHQLDQLHPELSPVDHLHEIAPNDRDQDYRNYLGRFGFSGERIFEPVAPFSGGEKARLVLALMIRQGPNLLLLDEPTNHLDLEMRQALSLALIEYSGALVVISHDRHLLRSVCDELLIVHRGKVERFALGIDDYPGWLNEQQRLETESHSVEAESSDTVVSRKQQRQQQAQRRQRLKPLYDAVNRIEKRLETHRASLHEYDQRLADESLYASADRKDELRQLVKDQAAARQAISELEDEWLTASDALESAD